MVWKVFFSFHYQLDIERAAVVRNSWVTKPDRKTAGFLDSANWEKIKLGKDAAIKSRIDREMLDTHITVVLIGAETYQRKFVKYEIKRSLELQHPIMGVYIDQIKNFDRKTSARGQNPFDSFRVTDHDNDIRYLSEVVHIYDWMCDGGHEHFSGWVEAVMRNQRYETCY